MNHIKETRKNKRLRQEDMANELGLSRTAYTNIENGKRCIDADMLSKIADILEVSMDYLYGRNENRISSGSLTKDETYLIEMFRNLNTKGRHALLTATEIMSGNPDMLKKMAEIAAG